MTEGTYPNKGGVSGEIELIEYLCRKCHIIHKKGDKEFKNHVKYLFGWWKKQIKPEKIVFT